MTIKKPLTLSLPIKLLSNRVGRSYTGGLLIEQWQNLPDPQDGNRPEEWIASIVAARNVPLVKDEGLSKALANTNDVFLSDIIASNPEFYLGIKHFRRYGTNFAVLTKVLDSAQRLSIQVHPTKAYSRKFFNSEFGKTEAWYIIGGRNIGLEKPYVLIGFKPGVTRDQWKKYFDEQDIDRMTEALHKFYVAPGDTVLIPGGTPHAIGSGCLLVEVQEPTDYTMRTERKKFNGDVLDDSLCHQGLGFNAMLDCFEYETLSEQKTREKYFKIPHILSQERGNVSTSIISSKDTECFSINCLDINTEMSNDDLSFKTCIILSGQGEIITKEGTVTAVQGESYFLGASLGSIQFVNKGEERFKVILCYPPSL